MNQQPAIILQHPKAPVTLHDPRDPYVKAIYEAPTPEQWEVLDATNGLYNLIQKYGADRVMTWVRSMASIAGQNLDRPTDRCLADGAALVNHICVQCGRDNS